MKRTTSSSRKSFRSYTIKLIKMFAGFVAFILIGFFCISWIVDPKKEGTEPGNIASINNVAGTDSTEMKRLGKDDFDNKLIATLRGKETKNIIDKVQIIERASEPDALIQKLSLNGLDAFHKKQAKSISKDLLTPGIKVELPPSDDSPQPISMQDLNLFHGRQATVVNNESNEFVQLFDKEATGGRQTVLSQKELDSIHQKQVQQSMADSELVTLPPVDNENEFSPLTLKELDWMIHREQLAAEFTEVDDKASIVLPPSSDEPHNLTNWELIELHAKQHELSIK